MRGRTATSDGRAIRALAREQHGVLTRRQLLDFGLTPKAIEHRVARGRLRRVHRGVYAVGAGELTRHGRWMAAVLRGGPGAVLSHESAAALWRLDDREAAISITLPRGRQCAERELAVHQGRLIPADVRTRWRIPVTSPARTLFDLSRRSSEDRLERLINKADRADLLNPEELREYVAGCAGLEGVGVLRTLLDKRTFRYTASELERRFLVLARRAGLPVPETSVRVEGFEVDFLWRDIRLIVETDGLRYHRTPAQLERDNRRDQAHAAAGYTTLRFSHSQLRFDPQSVVMSLMEVGGTLPF